MTFCLFTNFCCSVSQTADWQGTKQRGQHVHSRGHHLYNAFHADIPHRHTFQCQLSLLFIICPKTKNHPLLASATRLSPVSFSSHGDASVGGERVHSFSWKYNSRSVWPPGWILYCWPCHMPQHHESPNPKCPNDGELQGTVGIQCNQINVRLKN